jgi:hypothetical protein
VARAMTGKVRKEGRPRSQHDPPCVLGEGRLVGDTTLHQSAGDAR